MEATTIPMATTMTTNTKKIEVQIESRYFMVDGRMKQYSNQPSTRTGNKCGERINMAPNRPIIMHSCVSSNHVNWTHGHGKELMTLYIFIWVYVGENKRKNESVTYLHLFIITIFNLSKYFSGLTTSHFLYTQFEMVYPCIPVCARIFIIKLNIIIPQFFYVSPLFNWYISGFVWTLDIHCEKQLQQ